MNWISALIISLFSFGLWGFFTKLSMLTIDPKSALIYQSIGIFAVTLFFLFQLKFSLNFESKGFFYAILTGIAYALGCLFYFIAASKGKITLVVTLTALYPMITIFLSFIFLKETITYKQCLAIFLALASIFLLSS